MKKTINTEVTELWNGTLRIPIIIELAGIALISLGICVELVTHADVGHFMITGGAVVLAAGGLLFAKIIKRG